MIYRNNKEQIARYIGTKAILYVYKSTQLIWSAISSCFGSGMWFNDKVWSNNDAWKN